MALGLAGKALVVSSLLLRISPVSQAGPHLVKHHRAFTEKFLMLPQERHVPSPVFSTNCQHCEWTGEVALQARMKTTGRADVVSGRLYCLYFA